MYSDNFGVSILTSDGRVAREDENGVVVLSANQSYVIRVRNKNRLNCLVDLKIDEVSVISKGKLVVMGDDFSDLLGMFNGNKFKSMKSGQIVEAKFYLQKESNEEKGGITKRPIYIQEKEGGMLTTQWFPLSYYNDVQTEQKISSVANIEVMTDKGSVSASSVMDVSMDVSGIISRDSITSTSDFSASTVGFHNLQFNKEPIQIKLVVKSK